MANNPLISPPAVPALDQIKPEHYMPAIDQAIGDVEEKVKAIKSNPAAPTFENTVVALDGLFGDVNYILYMLSNQSANMATDELSAVEEAVSVKVSKMTKNIFQDHDLGARFQSVYTQRDSLPLDEDDKGILRGLFHSFESSGALLDAAGQQRVREIDEKLIGLANKFMQNAKKAPKQVAVHITDPAELAGLTVEEVARLKSNAEENGKKDGWLFIPERLLVDEMLEHAESSSFRRKIFESLEQIGKQPPYDNRPVIAEMQKLRHEYAQLLGYDNYAEYARSRAMTTDLAATRKLLQDVADKALPRFEQEMRSLEGFAAENGGPKKLEPWDVAYWATRQREALYHFDSNGFAKNLQLENVLKSMFSEAGHIFGLEFRESTGQYPVLQPDVRTFDVINKETGALQGILHMDLYARPGEKSGGAWMNQVQFKTGERPNVVIFNVNITKPPEGQQALVALSQYVTMYHEFGHSLHGLLGLDVKYPSQQGTAAPADFVEFHSMVNEHRATVEENLRRFALNVDTGLPPDEKTLKALKDSQSYFESRELLKLVQNSLRDLEFHSIDPKDYKGDIALENSVALDSPYAAHIRPYSLSRFDHLFSGSGCDDPGYAAGYVNYLIAQVHAADGFAPFEGKPYDAAWAQKLKHLYTRGGGGDPADIYKQYRGRAATPEAMLREIGANANTPPAPPKKAKGPGL